MRALFFFKAEFTGRKLEKAEEIFCAEKRE
jgi:hypothetical protein